MSPARCVSTISKDVPPESPLYVDVPRPPQPAAQSKPIVKGVLPVPRQLFHPTGPKRGTKPYLNRVSPLPKVAPREPQGKDKEFRQYKQRLTEMRRDSIREGLSSLKSRNKQAIKEMSKLSNRKREIQQANLQKPEREDDRLTSPTILPTIESMVSQQLTEEEIAAKRARYEAKEWAKSEERRNSLHTLYMNARDFIVTEEQLNAKIDAVFDDPFFENQQDPSIWAKEGVPEQMRDIRGQLERSGTMNLSESYSVVTRNRLQEIAEELTGGRMESEARVNERAGQKSL